MAKACPVFKPLDLVHHIWDGLRLPKDALRSLQLVNDHVRYPSSFKIEHIAQASIALSALSAVLVDSSRVGRNRKVRQVTVSQRQACLQFKTEALYTIDGLTAKPPWGIIGGLHQTKDGHVRIHDSFPHHRLGTLRLLGLPLDASREAVAARVRGWGALELEQKAHEQGIVIYALRSYADWDATAQGQAVSDFPIIIQKIGDAAPAGLPASPAHRDSRCLRGLRVLEFSRVIAAPVAGKALASHGAEVLWVTSPNLPDLPDLDRNLSRGKKAIQLDLSTSRDYETLLGLVQDCDVFVQGYRPGSLAQRGLGAADLAKLRPGIICANMSAFGPDGPWNDRRGFDSLVQTCSGMNVSEAEHYGDGAVARPMPCQALDHAAGYLLATGICAALYRRATEGGSWEVHVSLAAVMKCLRSLGQRSGKEAFECANPAADLSNLVNEQFEEESSAFGMLRILKEAAMIDGAVPGFDHPPKPGSDAASWTAS